MTSRARVKAPLEPVAAAPARRWLLFVHQLPPTPSNLRVRTWRRLQQVGAVPVKQAVYALPDTPSAREDFEWLKSEIEAAGGVVPRGGRRGRDEGERERDDDDTCCKARHGASLRRPPASR